MVQALVDCKCEWGLFRDRNVTLRKPVMMNHGIGDISMKGRVVQYDRWVETFINMNLQSSSILLRIWRMHCFRYSFYCSRLYFNSHGHVPLHWYYEYLLQKTSLPILFPWCPGFFFSLFCPFSMLQWFLKIFQENVGSITKARVASVLRYIEVSTLKVSGNDKRPLITRSPDTCPRPLHCLYFLWSVQCVTVEIHLLNRIRMQLHRFQRWPNNWSKSHTNAIYISICCTLEFLYFDTDTVKTQYSETLSRILIRAANDPSVFYIQGECISVLIVS